jgi:hypothetical protein
MPPVTPDYATILSQTSRALQTGEQVPRPTPAQVVAALLAAEKATKQDRQQFGYEQLLGNWRLGFVTGTNRSRAMAGQVIGAGRFLPKWVTIEISYQLSPPAEPDLQTRGQIGNCVTLGPLRLALSGPTQLWPRQNLLSFDFTRLTLGLGHWSLYQGYSWRGQQQEAQFYQTALKQQAFFNHFWVQPEAIAARGRGGGLALWVRKDAD